MKMTLSIFGILMMVVSQVAAQPSLYQFAAPKETPAQKAAHNAIKEWQPLQSTITLPVSIDNSILKFFPAIFNQGANNSCSQASGVRYAYTYQVNRLLGRDAKASLDNTFNYHFTWNYLNEGSNEGSHAYLGYNLMKQCGAMTLADMSDESATTSQTTWVTGYDKYIKAMKYSVARYEKINLKTLDGINRMKQYLYNSGIDGAFGGVASFSCYSTGWGEKSYSGTSSAGIKYIVTKSSKEGAHALTMVGYDDAVEYDFNGDGKIQEIERGAFIFVNSWGNWGDKGKSYFPYSLFLSSVENGGVREVDAEAYIVTPKIEEPKLYFKFKITYNRRNELFFRLGANDGQEKNSPNPDYTSLSLTMNQQGGAYPMRGEGKADDFKTMEVALNYSDYYEKVKTMTDPKFFLIVRRTAASGIGAISNFSVIDAVTGKEYVSAQTNISLSGGEIILFTGNQAISRSHVEWLKPGTATPYTSPFILRTQQGKNIKMKIMGYDKINGKMTIKYKKL